MEIVLNLNEKEKLTENERLCHPQILSLVRHVPELIKNLLKMPIWLEGDFVKVFRIKT